MPSKKSHRTVVKNTEYNRPISSKARTLLKNSIELIEENKQPEEIKKSYNKRDAPQHGDGHVDIAFP